MALHKARHFVLGCPHLIVAVDHLPLLSLLNDKTLADIHNPRLLALKEKTLWFRYKMVHVPGGMHCGPDYMSRHGQEGAQTISIKEARLHCITGLLAGLTGSDTEGVLEDRFIGVEDGLLITTIATLTHGDGIQAVTFNRIK